GSQRYLSEHFGQHFRDTYGAAYLDYMGDPDVTWRQSAAQSSALTPGQCTVEVTSMRTAAGSSGAVAETYTLVETYLGWRIDGGRWQAQCSWRSCCCSSARRRAPTRRRLESGARPVIAGSRTRTRRRRSRAQRATAETTRLPTRSRRTPAC